MAHMRFGKRQIKLPENRVVRIATGAGFVAGGVVGPVLPVLGVWMIPVGLYILSVDLHPVRRFRRRMEVRYVPKWREFRARRRERRARDKMQATAD